MRRGDYGLRDITQKRHQTSSNLLITLRSSLEGGVHHYTGLRLNTPDVVEALHEAASEPKADIEKHAGN